MAKVIIKVNGSVMVVAILILIVNMGSNNGLKYELYYVIVNNASKRLSNIDLTRCHLVMPSGIGAYNF